MNPFTNLSEEERLRYQDFDKRVRSGERLSAEDFRWYAGVKRAFNLSMRHFNGSLLRSAFVKAGPMVRGGYSTSPR